MQDEEINDYILTMIKSGIASLLLLLIVVIQGTAQNAEDDFYYNHTFTRAIEKFQLDLRLDSLQNYVLTSKKNKYLPKADLVLVHPDSENEFIILLDQGISLPQITLSSHVTNLMDNETDHTLAFYSLDSDFVSEILHADWAVDTQFIPRDQTDQTGYARSFYREKSDLQITLILLTKNLPLLSTPREMRSLRFRSEEPR